MHANTGTIVKYFDERGYGFIQPRAVSADDSDDGGDIYFPRDSFLDGTIPAEGMTVSYDVSPPYRDGKRRAVGLQLISLRSR